MLDYFKNYDILQFQPLIDYIAFLESQGYEFVSENEEFGWPEYISKEKDHKLTIVRSKDDYREWITFYKMRNRDESFEQTEFMFLNEKYMAFFGKKDYNHRIKYAAHFEDEQFTRMVCSSYLYKDNNLLEGWRELRKFAVQDLDKVIYNKSMNLTELTLMADKKIFEFYEVKSLKGKEVKELKLEY